MKLSYLKYNIQFEIDIFEIDIFLGLNSII